MREMSERDAPGGCDLCSELLPWYVAGTLTAREHDFIAEHIGTCAGCARELAALRSVAQMVAAEGQAVQPAFTSAVSWERFGAFLHETAQEQVVPAGLAEITDAVPVTSPVLRKGGRGGVLAGLATAGGHFARVLAAQARLMRAGVWVASALGIVLAALYATLVPTVSAGNVLTFALPLIAASGMAFLYGPENDPSLELALGTPTSARAVLFGRFALLFGYDAALAVAATGLVAASRGENIWLLASLWFGPMALLSTISLALSLLVNPMVAGGMAAALWFSRLVHLDDGASLRLTPAMLWHTSPQILAISLGLLLVTLLYASRHERLASEEHLN
ncbi:MAG TPA: zf-HC2 domain-containing protein [Ktedonobacterales bacterium]